MFAGIVLPSPRGGNRVIRMIGSDHAARLRNNAIVAIFHLDCFRKTTLAGRLFSYTLLSIGS